MVHVCRICFNFATPRCYSTVIRQAFTRTRVRTESMCVCVCLVNGVPAYIAAGTEHPSINVHLVQLPLIKAKPHQMV